jgi:hypothetical protein
MFAPPHCFVEEIYISGQIKQKTIFCSIQKFQFEKSRIEFGIIFSRLSLH